MFRRRATWYTAALIVLTGVVLALEGGRYGAEYMSVAPRRRRLKIVMFSTPNIVDQYAGLAAEINELYARRHGYEFEHVVEDVTPVGDRTEMMWRCVDVINDAMRDVTVWGVLYRQRRRFPGSLSTPRLVVRYSRWAYCRVLGQTQRSVLHKRRRRVRAQLFPRPGVGDGMASHEK